MLQALGPLVAAASTGVGKELRRLLSAHNLGLPGVPAGTQTVPDCSSFAPPIHSAVEKDRVRLQVGLRTVSLCSGTALFSGVADS